MDLSEIRNIRLNELVNLLGIGKSSIYQLIGSGLLPPPIHMSQRCSTWPIYEIKAVIAARAAQKTDVEIRAVVCDMIQARQAGI